MKCVNSFVIKNGEVKEQETIDTALNTNRPKMYLEEISEGISGSKFSIQSLIDLSREKNWYFVIDFLDGEYSSVEIEIYLKNQEEVPDYSPALKCKSFDSYVCNRKVILSWIDRPHEIKMDKEKWLNYLEDLSE